MNKSIQPIGRDKYLTDEELVAGYHFCQEHEHMIRWATACFLFRLINGSGLRVSEVVSTLVPECIDAKGFIIVKKETAKTNRERLVKVTPELLPYWRVWLQKIPVPGPLIPRPRLDIAGDMWVTTKTGRSYKRKPTSTIMARAPYSRFDLGRMWDDVLVNADIGIRDGKPMSIHKGRHTWATWELASGRCSLTEVQCQLGHISPEMTQGFYLHAVTELMYELDKTPAWRAAALGEFQGEIMAGAPRLQVV